MLGTKFKYGVKNRDQIRSLPNNILLTVQFSEHFIYDGV